MRVLAGHNYEGAGQVLLGHGLLSDVAVVVPVVALPVNTVVPAISGTPRVGQLLSCTTGTWTGTAPIAYAYQWRRGGATIGGATSATYTAAAADDLANLTCVVTATNAGGSVSQASNALSITYAAPTAGTAIGAQSYTQSTGIQTVNMAPAFVGAALVYSLPSARTGVSVNASTGVVSVNTDTSGLASGETITVRATNSGGALDRTFSLSVTPVVADVAPTASAITVGAYDPETDSAPITITDLSEDAADCYLILSATDQIAAGVTSAQVRSGLLSTGAAAQDDAGFAVTVASPAVTVSGLVAPPGTWFVTVVLGDAGGAYGDPVGAGSFTVTSSAVAPTYRGDGSGSPFGTTHTFNSASAGTVALPATFDAGKWAVQVADLNGESRITNVVIDGTAAIKRGAGYNGASKSLETWEADIAGGGTATIVVTVSTGSNRVHIAAHHMGSLTYQGEVAQLAPNAASPDVSSSFTTSAGDAVLACYGSVPTTEPVYINMALRKAASVINSRQFGAASNLNTTGGSPEAFVVDFSEGFKSEAVLAVHYA